MNTNWLSDLAKQSLGDFEATVELDWELSYLARQARNDDEVSWQLFGLLAWKIERFVGRFRFWDLEPFDLDDVVQESCIVFLETVREWPPDYVDIRPTGFLYYFLKLFPLRLARRVRGWRRPARPALIRMVSSSMGSGNESDRAIVDEFCRNLDSLDATLLRLHLTKGLSVRRAADRMGLPRRTAYRRWRHILKLGREFLREAG